jgi:hypothetical protein
MAVNNLPESVAGPIALVTVNRGRLEKLRQLSATHREKSYSKKKASKGAAHSISR